MVPIQQPKLLCSTQLGVTCPLPLPVPQAPLLQSEASVRGQGDMLLVQGPSSEAVYSQRQRHCGEKEKNGQRDKRVGPSEHMSSPKEEEADYPKGGGKREQEFRSNVGLQEWPIQKATDRHGELPDDQHQVHD